MKTLNYLAAFMIAAMFASCSKGDTGATGPAGPQGPSGAVNLTVSTYTVYPGDWTTGSNFYNWYYNTNVAPTTSDMVTVYFSHDGSFFTSIPDNGIFTANSDQLYYNIGTGYYLQLGYYNEGEVAPSGYTNSTLYFNVAVIPPSIYVKYPNVNWKNPSEVQKLPEYQKALKQANSSN